MRTSTETLDQFRIRLAVVRSRLLKIEPFLSYLSLELPTHILEETDVKASEIETAATDGRQFFYNHKWCRNLTDRELMFVVCHEVGHVMLHHASRTEKRNQTKWNVACDYVINLLLTTGSTANHVQIPIENGKVIGLLNAKYKNLTAEQVYTQLPDDNQPVWDPFLPDNSGPTSGQHSNSDKAHQVHTAASSAIARALSRAKERHNPGQEPSIFERLAESGMTPTVNWETHLQFCLTSSGHDDYNWARPNRRLRPHGFYLPSYRGFQIPKTLFVFDTSGSISSEFLGQMAAELNKLLSIARNSTITILSCDTEVHVIGEFSAVKPFKPKEHRLVGGGGTSFIEPFNYAVKHKFEQLIYMTDTEGSFPDKETVKTIWLVPEARKHAVPFGKTIVIPYFY